MGSPQHTLRLARAQRVIVDSIKAEANEEVEGTVTWLVSYMATITQQLLEDMARLAIGLVEIRSDPTASLTYMAGELGLIRLISGDYLKWSSRHTIRYSS